MVFDFADQSPAEGLNAYRIVGVTWPGKPVFSNIVDILITGVLELTGREAVRIWPNPAQTTLFLEMPASATSQLRAFSSSGRLIHQQTFNTAKNIISIDVSVWPAGLYLLLWQRHDGPRHAARILIVR
jgi:hypothetical protein